jgi:hypothetical protein
MTTKTSAKSVHLDIKDLPPQIQRAIKSVYRKPSIEVIPATEYSTSGAGFEGNRAIAVGINLSTGKTETLTGSWGGRNPFENKPVDRPQKNKLPPNMAVLLGESGGRGTFMRLYVHPSNFDSLALAGETVSLSDKEQKALNMIAGLNSRGRKDEFPREGMGEYGPTNQYVKSLAEKGLVKIQGRAVKITTKGRNQRSSSAGRYGSVVDECVRIAAKMPPGKDRREVLDLVSKIARAHLS